MSRKAEVNIAFDGSIRDGYPILLGNILESYPHPCKDVKIKFSKLKALQKAFKDTYSDIKIFDYSLNGLVEISIKNKDFFCIIKGWTGYITLTGFCKDIETSQEIFNLCKNYSEDRPSELSLLNTRFYIEGNYGLRNSDSYMEYDSLISNDKYYPYLDLEEMFKQFSSLNDNILILVGEPGTGKSKLCSSYLKYMLRNPEYFDYNKDDECICISFVKSIDVLAKENFWITLKDYDTQLVVLDDLDFFLIEREAEIKNIDDNLKNKFLTNFLSYTDGVDKNKTKFIITTNQSYDDMDKAILRKGRLFDILELRPLHNDEALNIWLDEGLDKKLFKFKGDVLASDLGAEIEKVKKNTSFKEYCLESSISKLNKKSKKLGF